jgi:hypothetical protein
MSDNAPIMVSIPLKDVLFAKLCDLEEKIYTQTAPRHMTRDKTPIPNSLEKWTGLMDDICEIRQLIKKHLK